VKSPTPPTLALLAAVLKDLNRLARGGREMPSAGNLHPPRPPASQYRTKRPGNEAGGSDGEGTGGGVLMQAELIEHANLGRTLMPQDLADEFASARAARCVEDLRRRAFLDRRALVHHHNLG
jgi:hypothetical protein